MEIKLTRDADVLICLIYKAYCEKLDSGISKSKAKLFDDLQSICDTIAPKWNRDDVLDTCLELHAVKLFHCDLGSGGFPTSELTSAGIIYMEGRFGRRVSNVLDYLNKILFFK